MLLRPREGYTASLPQQSTCVLIWYLKHRELMSFKAFKWSICPSFFKTFDVKITQQTWIYLIFHNNPIFHNLKTLKPPENLNLTGIMASFISRMFASVYKWYGFNDWWTQTWVCLAECRKSRNCSQRNYSPIIQCLLWCFCWLMHGWAGNCQNQVTLVLYPGINKYLKGKIDSGWGTVLSKATDLLKSANLRVASNSQIIEL